MWLPLALTGYTLLALVAILDKFVVSTQRVHPLKFTFFSTIIALPVLLFLPFGLQPLPTSFAWVLAFLGGTCYALALLSLYSAFAKGEVSHLGPLIGALVPVFTLLFTVLFLPEPLTALHYVGITLLVLGSGLVGFKKSHHAFWRPGSGLALLAGFFFAAFFVISKYIYTLVDFKSGFVWLWGSMGLFALTLLVFPIVRAKTKQPFFHRTKTTTQLIVITLDKGLALVAIVLIQLAIARGPVILINALGGWQYGILVVLVALLSRFSPQRFREKYTPGELQGELAAVACIALGLGTLIYTL